MVAWKSLCRSAAVLAVSFYLICTAGALCQQSQPDGNQPNQKQSTGNAAPASKNSNPDNNAFPMAQSEAAAKADSDRASQQNKPSASQGTDTPEAPAAKKSTATSNQKKGSASQDNPFPEAQSKAAAKTETNGSADKSSHWQPGSASPDGNYSSSDAHLPPPDLGEGNLGLHRKLDSYTRDQTQDGRIEDDLKVADLYMKNGNFRGALMRYQDALQYDPQDDSALFGVADAMCKQNLTAEAMARFKSYAKNNPQGRYALKAEKMLAHPNKCMHNW